MTSPISPIYKPQLSPIENVSKTVTDLLIEAQVKAQQFQKKCSNNIENLNKVRKENQELEEEGKMLGKIEEIFVRVLGDIQKDNSDDEKMEGGQKQNKQILNEDQNEQKQSHIQVKIPNLDNLLEYFTELVDDELLNKYEQMRVTAFKQNQKHNQQVIKYTNKLSNIDTVVNETLANIKNQRKIF